MVSGKSGRGKVRGFIKKDINAGRLSTFWVYEFRTKAEQKSSGKERSFYFSQGNRKLSKGTLVWNLPRLKTCPCAGICKQFCYEIKTERLYKNALPCRERNLAFSKTTEFVPEIVAYLRGRKEKTIRLHGSGDLYSKEYFQKWRQIAIQCPEKLFYCYTKSFGLFNVYEKLPQNLIMIQSYGSSMDNKIDKNNNTARVIDDIEEISIMEYLCPVTPPYKKKCGIDCTFCQDKKRNGNIRVAFLKH